MRKYLFLLALLGATAPVMAQDKPAAPTTAAAKPKLEIINQGELRLDGKITALLGAGVWQLEASSWTSPRGVTTEFEEPKNKSITVGAGAYLHPRGEEEKVALGDVKLGSLVAIIGKNGPDGTVVAREVVLLEGYGSRKTVGSVSTNPYTSLLVDQSRAARDLGQLPKAMQLIDKAIATARGLGDSSGEALATQDKALLHVDLDQPEEALKAFKRGEAIGRNLGNPLILAMSLRGSSGLLLRQGQVEQAINSLKEADPVSANAGPEVQLSVLGTLARAYLVNGQLAEGIATLNRIQPLEQAQGKDADAGETLLMIAALQAPEKSDEARDTLKAVQERIDRARDEKAKGGLLGTAALVRWRLGEKEEAKAGFTQAAQLLNGAGDSAGAKQWEQMAQNLEGAGAEWQSFWLAATGLKLAAPKADGDNKPPAQNRSADEQ